MKINFNIASGFIITGIVYCIGGFDKSIQTLGIFMIIDYITGLASSIYNKRLSAKKGFDGIIKKGAYICLVITCVEIDRFLGTDGTWRNIIIYSLCVNDILSIFENIAQLNVPLPKSLKNLLKKFNEYDVDEKEII